MKHLILLCSNLHIETFAHYITSTFQQDDGLPGLSVVWHGKTTRHEIGLIVIEGQEIPERLQDMIFLARDLFDFTEVFEVPAASPASDPAHQTPPEGHDPTNSS